MILSRWGTLLWPAFPLSAEPNAVISPDPLYFISFFSNPAYSPIFPISGARFPLLLSPCPSPLPLSRPLLRPLPPHRSDVLIYGARGKTFSGISAVEATYKDFCAKEFGLAPFQFRIIEAERLGTVLYVKWRLTSGALAKPYYGADAYGTRGQQMAKIVTTFDKQDLERK